jgi:hypothetical protein
MIRSVLAVVLSLAAPAALAVDQGIFPQDLDALAHQVDDIWVPVDSGAALTQDKSENALELLERLHEGRVDLQADVTGWDPPKPTTVAEAVWALRYRQTAAHVGFKSKDVIGFEFGSPNNVEDAIKALAQRATSTKKVVLDTKNAVHYGLENPQTADDALAILARRVYELEARVYALENP